MLSHLIWFLCSFILFFFYVFKFFFFNFILFLNLKHCISFAKHQNESATGIHVLPMLNPPPSSLPTPSLWVVPVHQPQASSIVHCTWTGNSFHTWYYTCLKLPLILLKTLLLSDNSSTSQWHSNSFLPLKIGYSIRNSFPFMENDNRD